MQNLDIFMYAFTKHVHVTILKMFFNDDNTIKIRTRRWFFKFNFWFTSSLLITWNRKLTWENFLPKVYNLYLLCKYVAKIWNWLTEFGKFKEPCHIELFSRAFFYPHYPLFYD